MTATTTTTTLESFSTKSDVWTSCTESRPPYATTSINR